MSTSESEVREHTDDAEVAEQEVLDAAISDTNDIWVRDTPNELIPKMGELPVSSAAYYQQLIITEAAGSGGSSGPLDKRINPFASDEVSSMHLPSVGVLLTFEQGWFQEGLALGELRKSLCLAPGEVTKVAVVDWRRQTSSRDQSATEQSEVLAAQTDDASAAVTVQKSMLEETRSSSSFVMGSSSHHQAGGSGGIPLLFSASGSTSKSSFMGFSATASAGERNVGAEASKNIQRRTQQLSQSARSARATQIREVSEEEEQTTTTRVVANYNHAHALTMQYYEVLQIYRLKTRVIRADRCIFVPIKPLSFNEQSMVATTDATLELLRHVLQDFGASRLDDMVADFQRKLPVFKELRKLAAEAVALRSRVGAATSRKIEAPRVLAVEIEYADGQRAVIRSTQPAIPVTAGNEEGLSAAQKLVGTYENFPQNSSIKNDWHYVNITAKDETNLFWTNRAGVSWSLKITDNAGVLEVGTDCPYYATGYTRAQVVFDAYGNVKHVTGPGDSPYLNEERRIRRLIGLYENFPKDANQKNDWHYVTIAIDNSNVLKWTNRAGVSWALRLTGDDDVLAVGPDCPYFASGYTSARVGFDLMSNVTHVIGPGSSPYINEATSKLDPPQWAETSATVVPSPLLNAADAAADPTTPLIDQEGRWQRTSVATHNYISQGESRGRIWDQWSWYMVNVAGPGVNAAQVTETDLVHADMWRRQISFGSGAPPASIVAQFQSDEDHRTWVEDSLRLSQVERRYAIDRKDLDAFGRLFGLLDDVALFLNQQMWMRTDDYTWRGLLTGRVFPHGEYEGQDIGGMVNPTPIGFFGNYLAFNWDFPQDRLGETTYREQAEAFNKVFINSEEVAAAKTKTEATIALPTEGIFAEAVLGQSNSAEKIDMTRFWNWQESPIPILPPEMAAVNTGSRARDVAGPDRLRLAEALVALRTAGVDKSLIDDSAILAILNESLDNGDSAALLANAVTSATTASDNASKGAGSAGQASVDVSKQIQDFIVDLANSEAAKIATDAALTYATGGASKMGGLLNKASKGASLVSSKTASSKTSAKSKASGKAPAKKGSSSRKRSAKDKGAPAGSNGDSTRPVTNPESTNTPDDSGVSKTGKRSGAKSKKKKPDDASVPEVNDGVNSASQLAETEGALAKSAEAMAIYEQKWNHYLEHSARSQSSIESVEDHLVIFVSACSYFDTHYDRLKPRDLGELDADSQALVDVVNRAAESFYQLTLLIGKFAEDDENLFRNEDDSVKQQQIKAGSELNQKQDQRLLDNLGDVVFDMQILITSSLTGA